MKSKGALGIIAGKLVAYGILLALTLALIDYFFANILPLLESIWESLRIISGYKNYITVIVVLVSGWLIINSTSNTLYQLFKQVYGKQGAGAVRSVVRILGTGALLASIAGWIAGGAAGVALGGFIGIVVGFATQQVLGQAIAGLFILLARPYRIGDIIDLEKEKEKSVKVVDITTLFTILKRENGDIVLVPNNNVINQKIIIHNKNK